MISPDDLVGTIVTLEGDGEVLLTKFLGEGAEAVVYATASLCNPADDGTFTKFFKPLHFLEMNVLNHRFRVHKELYPTHPLLLEPGVRLRLLTEEMSERILSPRCEFHVKTYRDVMEAAIRGIVEAYATLYDQGQFKMDDLLQDPSVVPRLDENLLYRVRELLDEDAIVDKYVPFLEFLARAISDRIEQWKQAGEYLPFSTNVLYNLLGVKIADFVNNDEMFAIARNPRIMELVSSRRIIDLWRFVTILYTRASSMIRNREEEAGVAEGPRSVPEGFDAETFAAVVSEVRRRTQEGRIDDYIAGGISGCEIVEHFASMPQWSSSRLRGLARYWLGKTVSLRPGNDEVARAAFDAALEHFEDNGDSRLRARVLMDLGDLLREIDPEGALKYMLEAQKIVKAL